MLGVVSPGIEDIGLHARQPPFMAPKYREVVYFSTVYPFRTDALRILRLRLRAAGSDPISFETLLTIIQSCARLRELALEWSLELVPSDAALLTGLSFECPSLRVLKCSSSWDKQLHLWLSGASSAFDALTSYTGSWPLEFYVGPRTSLSAYESWAAVAPLSVNDTRYNRDVQVIWSRCSTHRRPPARVIAGLGFHSAKDFLPKVDTIAFEYFYEAHGAHATYADLISTLPAELSYATSSKGQDRLPHFSWETHRSIRFANPILCDDAPPELRNYMAQFMVALIPTG
ncbi:unnamed protein product [Peniophora sp. CBMAI 1063]|nr:unnamed protein product [Peniophora sp. CBMAI 1063]